MNKRLYFLDICRIVCAVMVFLFHASIHIKIDFKCFNDFIGLSHIFIVAFFMLSGFCLYYNSSKTNFINLRDSKSVIHFVAKRIIKIYPLYIAYYVLFIFLKEILPSILNETLKKLRDQ